MTLTSHAVFLTPTNPEAVFGLARKLVGIPDDQPFKVERQPWHDDDRVVFRSEPGGFKAMCWVYVDTHAESYRCDCRERYNDDDCRLSSTRVR